MEAERPIKLQGEEKMKKLTRVLLVTEKRGQATGK